MTRPWNSFEGKTVDGSYTLTRILKASQRHALFEGEGGGHTCVLRLEDGETAEAPLLEECWSRAVHLSHPNLIRVLGSGRCEIESIPVVYVAMERAEETLGDVLASRPLTDVEAREMLGPALDALDYLHAQRLVHGAVRKSHVMACGDLLKLSSTSIMRSGQAPLRPEHAVEQAPELEGGVITPASDMWSLGRLLTEALSAESAAESPFREIIENCLQPEPGRRWITRQVREALNEERVIPAEQGRLFGEAAALGEAAAMGKAAAALGGGAEGGELWAPAASEERVGPEPRRTLPAPVRFRVEAKEETGRTRPWLIPAAVLAGLLIVIWGWTALSGKHPAERKAQSSVAATGPALAPAVAPASSPALAPALTPAGKPAARPAEAAAPEPVERAKTAVVKGRRGDRWFVVVATYAQREHAEHRAREITKRSPHFPAHIFAPAVENPHYLVVIGANLSEDGAQTLRKRALAAGLPSDLYIKRFPG